MEPILNPAAQPETASPRPVLVGLAFLGVALLGSLVYPSARALLSAAVLAGALYPLFEWLTARLRGKAVLASLLLTIMVTTFLTAPTVWLAVRMADEALTGMASVERAMRGGGGVPELVRLLPAALQPRARHLLDGVPGASAQLEDAAGNRSGQTTSAVTIGLVATGKLAFDFFLMMAAFFFLLIDGRRMVQWIAEVAPLPATQVIEILVDFRTVSVAVLLSSLGTAGAQAVTALVGYLAAGVPQPLFFTLVTFVVAFIPAVGASSVVIGLAGLLLFSGQTQPAFYLALWGLFVVSTVDHLVKPWLLRGRMEIHGGLIFFSLVGGAATFGPVGLVAGPLILSFFLAAVRLNAGAASAGNRVES